MRKLFNKLTRPKPTQELRGQPMLLGAKALSHTRYADQVRAALAASLLPSDCRYPYVGEVIHAVADRYQAIPASADHHHAYHGGLLSHTLDVAVRALSAQRENPPADRSQSVAENYAVFVGALLHDFGKSVFRFNLRAFDGNGNFFCHLNGLSERASFDKAACYEIITLSSRYADQSNSGALGLFLLPPAALAFLSAHPRVLAELLATLYSDSAAWGRIGEFVKAADKASVASDLRRAAVRGHGVSAVGQTLEQFRQAVFNQSLTWNSDSSQGWRVGNTLYLQAGSLYQIAGKGLSMSFGELLTLWQQNGLCVGDKAAVKIVWFRLPGSEDAIERRVIELNPDVIDAELLNSVTDVGCVVLDTPPVDDGGVEVYKTTVAKGRALHAAAQGDKAAGEHFIGWVKAALASRELTFNSPGSSVHVLGDYALLVSPRVCKLYLDWLGVEPSTEAVEKVQAGFQKLGLHIKAVNPNSSAVSSFHSASVTGSKNKVRGYLVPTGVLFDTPPAPNPALKLISKHYTKR